MERVPQVLQFPVIVKRCGSLAREPQRLQKFDLLSRHIPAERRILQERLKAWLSVHRGGRLPFHELDLPQVLWREAAVRVLPGRYIARLTASGETVEQPFHVRLDPRVKASDEDLLEHSGSVSPMFAVIPSMILR